MQQHVTSTMPEVPKKRKNKELAFEHFEKAVAKNDNAIAGMDALLKIQGATALDLRKKVREVIRESKEVRKYLKKYKNIQYKPKRVRVFQNTGLEKLRPISKNMALFVDDWEYGTTTKSRNDVTNVLCAYIKEHNLQDPSKGTIIRPDAKLKELLQVEDDVVLKYPTMQKYLKHCFNEPSASEPTKIEDSSEKQPIKKKVAPKKTAKKPTTTALNKDDNEEEDVDVDEVDEDVDEVDNEEDVDNEEKGEVVVKKPTSAKKEKSEVAKKSTKKDTSTNEDKVKKSLKKKQSKTEE